MFSFGFYDSLNGDRKYNSLQMSEIFDGIIGDGVYDSIGELMAVSPAEGMQVSVGTGRAWFNHTWNKNDGSLLLDIPKADVLLTRFDAVVLEVDRREESRYNSIKVIQGIPSARPAKPVLANGQDEVWQHPLAFVKVEPNITELSAAAIENAVGTSACPFVTGIVQTADINVLFQQWDGEFDEWFENVKSQLSDNVVTNLQYQIDRCVKKLDKATEEDVKAGTPDKWVDAKAVKVAVTSDNDPIGTIKMSLNNLEEQSVGKWVACDQRIWKRGEIPDKIFEKYRHRISASLEDISLGISAYAWNAGSKRPYIYELLTDPYEICGAALYRPDLGMDAPKNKHYAYIKDPGAMKVYPPDLSEQAGYGASTYAISMGDETVCINEDEKNSRVLEISVFDKNASLKCTTTPPSDTPLLKGICYIPSLDRYVWWGGGYKGKSIGYTDTKFRSVSIVTSPDRISIDPGELGSIYSTVYNGGPFSVIQHKFNTMYLLSYPNGFLKSTDHGLSWSFVETDITMTGTGLPRGSYYIDDENHLCFFSKMVDSSDAPPNRLPQITLTKKDTGSGATVETKLVPIVGDINLRSGLSYCDMHFTEVANNGAIGLSPTRFIMGGTALSSDDFDGIHYILIYDTKKERFEAVKIPSPIDNKGVNGGFLNNGLTGLGDGRVLLGSLSGARTQFVSGFSIERGYSGPDCGMYAIYDDTSGEWLSGFPAPYSSRMGSLYSCKGGFMNRSVANTDSYSPQLVISSDKIRAPYIENGYIKIKE